MDCLSGHSFIPSSLGSVDDDEMMLTARGLSQIRKIMPEKLKFQRLCAWWKHRYRKEQSKLKRQDNAVDFRTGTTIRSGLMSFEAGSSVVKRPGCVCHVISEPEI
ncbi:hypothetical protein TNCV_4107951 [Trichonephila clavipes]|nr:hypothetical protein TNCV_4107951 [Trichonephila clavipes]